MTLHDDSLAFLNKAAVWARFLAIAGFVWLLLMLLSIGLVALLGGGANAMAWSPTMYAAVLIFMGVCLAVSIPPVVCLHCFANRTLRAVADGDNLTLAQSLRSLRNFFVLSGIAVIVLFAAGFLFYVAVAILA